MASYSVRIRKSALKELEAVAIKADRQHIAQRISSLADNLRPPGCQMLSGRERYRIRQGNYRILYAINDSELFVFIIRVDLWAGTA